MIQTCACHVLY